ncbi:class I SAM-dependent DNA methyltransferase [Fodinibius salsisoli]|uniref:Class I SAM-dependent methyltransferase n=1 Tax=Fodinibius salsisoli TaxID=2820877 RepID=A0ABT3PQT1_9BACT|nr:class I SAM-dependent methyltransferase [Fodinibius salsisoli]MCW9708232.1 class I SAM-dependent methyltransferase [Fodinibius salsisoli]
MNIKERPAYTTLAEIYDAVMQEVNYDFWADFLDALMLQHHPNPESVMELACGTGSLALSLDELECYEMWGTDRSPEMIAKARQKNKDRMCSVNFSVMNFLDITIDRTFDVVICVFDSINYLHEPKQVLRFLQECQKLLGPKSLLIFDFTTPINSMEAIDYLNNEEDTTDNHFHFLRRSTYDAEKQIHTNRFEIQKLSADHQTVEEEFVEVHRQKIYTLQQMLDIIDQTPYTVVAKYNEFEFEEANEESLRITMVLQCLHTQS